MFVPNLDTLRSNFSSFASRGTAPSAQFAQRFGGYQGTPFVAQQFRGEPDEGFRSAIPDSRKFAQAFEQPEETIAPQPSYTPPPQPEPTVTTVPPSFFANLTASQSYVQRTESDASMMNVAANLRATEDTAAAAVQNPTFDPARIQAILNATRNPFGFDGRMNPALFQNREDVVPFNEPDLGRALYSNEGAEPVVSEPETPEPVPYDPPPVYVPQPPPPYQPEPTYSRADEEDEEIDSIDVVGAGRDEEEIDSIDVSGSREPPKRTKPRQERDYIEEATEPTPQPQQAYGGDNPWETFKALYTDFMTGGKGGAVLQEFNKREAQGQLGYDYNPVSDPTSFVQAYESGMGKDTNAIMRAKLEREEYDSRAGEVFRKDQTAMAGATIINNNQTIATTRSQEMSRTNRVFGDDNTFNRLAAADSNNPRFG